MNNNEQPQTNQPPQLEVKRNNRRRWVGITSLSALLLGAALAIAALHFLAPVIPGRAESFSARVGWYLTHGQWRADSRTFAAAWNYYLRSDNEMPSEVSVTNGPLAATPCETLPKS